MRINVQRFKVRLEKTYSDNKHTWMFYKTLWNVYSVTSISSNIFIAIRKISSTFWYVFRKHSLQEGLIEKESEFVRRIPRKVQRNTQVMYPVVSEYEAITKRNREPEKSSLSQRYQVQKYLTQGYVNLSMIGRPNFFMSRPLVRAAGLLKKDSTTEIIHVNKLCEGNTSITQHVCNIKNFVQILHCFI